MVGILSDIYVSEYYKRNTNTYIQHFNTKKPSEINKLKLKEHIFTIITYKQTIFSYKT